MNYRDRVTGQYPLTLDAVRARVNIAFGDTPTQEVLDAANVDLVEAVDQPAPVDGKVVREGAPKKVGKVWRQTWIVEDAPVPDRTADIEAEKLRRIEAGFSFAGKVIQSRAEDRENIAGAKSAAQDAKLLGAQPGELDWQKKLDEQKGAPVFAWITLDNSLLPLDADSMIEMGYAAMLHKQAYIFAAKGLKDRVEAGEAIADVTADEHWPG